MMDIFISRGAQDPEVRIRFPAEPDIVWSMLRELDEYCASNDPARIVGTSCLVPNLTQYISCVNVKDAADIRKLNELADLVDGMSTGEQHIFAGALDAESVNGLDDVLRIASNLGQYEFIEGVTSDKELGGWLVDRVCEPLMARLGPDAALTALLGSGKGSGAALLFLVIAFAGVAVCLLFRRDRHLRALDAQDPSAP